MKGCVIIESCKSCDISYLVYSIFEFCFLPPGLDKIESWHTFIEKVHIEWQSPAYGDLKKEYNLPLLTQLKVAISVAVAVAGS